MFVKALLCRNPFSFAVPSSFQNQAAICLSTANIGINFQSTKFFRENFFRARLFSQNPFTFHPPYRLSSSFSSSLPLLSCPLPCPPFPSFPVLCLVLPPHTRAHTHAHACAPIRAHDARARLRSHAHARNIYHPISYTPIIQQKIEKKNIFS